MHSKGLFLVGMRVPLGILYAYSTHVSHLKLFVQFQCFNNQIKDGGLRVKRELISNKEPCTPTKANHHQLMGARILHVYTKQH